MATIPGTVPSDILKQLSYHGSAYFNVMNGIGKDNLVVDGDSLLQYALRGRPEFDICNQPLGIASAVEHFTFALLTRGSILRILFQQAFDTPPAVDTDGFGLLRDVLRLHLLVNVRHPNISVDDHSYLTTSLGSSARTCTLTSSNIQVPHTFGSEFRDVYLSEVKPSSFMLDLHAYQQKKVNTKKSAGAASAASGPVSGGDDQDDDDGASIDDGDATGHSADAEAIPSSTDVLRYRRFCEHVLRSAESFHILTNARLPVVLMKGYTRNGRVEFNSNKAMAFVRWPFGPNDAAAADITAKSIQLAAELQNPSAAIGIPPAFPEVDVDAALDRAANLVLASPNLSKGGWGMLAGVAAASLFATSKRQQSGAAMPLALESFLIHLVLLSSIDVKHRAIDDAALETLGAPIEALYPVLSLKDMDKAGCAAAADIRGASRSVIRAMMRTIQTGSVPIAASGVAGATAAAAGAVEAGQAAQRALSTLASGSIVDIFDVRLWRLVHGVLLAGLSASHEVKSSGALQSKTALYSMLFNLSESDAKLLAGISLPLPITGEQSSPSVLQLAASTLDLIHHIASSDAGAAGQAQPCTLTGVPQASLELPSLRVFKDALTLQQSAMRAALATTMSPPQLARLAQSRSSFHAKVLGNSLNVFSQFETGKGPTYLLDGRVRAFWNDNYHTHTMRRVRLSRIPRELRLKDAANIVTKDANLNLTTDIKAVVVQTSTKKAHRKMANEAKRRALVAEGLQGGPIQRKSITQSSAASGQAGGDAASTTVNIAVSRECGRLKGFEDDYEKSKRVLENLRKQAGSEKTPSAAFDVLARYGLSTITVDCQSLPASDSDKRCHAPCPSYDSKALRLDNIKEKKARKEHEEKLEAALKKAVAAWTAWKRMDCDHDLEMLKRRFTAWQAASAEHRGLSSVLTAELYNASEAILRLYWPSFYASTQSNDVSASAAVKPVSSYPDLCATIDGAIASHKSTVAAAAAVRGGAADVLCPADAKAMKQVYDSELLPALLAIEPARLLAAKLTIALVTVGSTLPATGSSAPKDGVTSLGPKVWTKLKAEWTKACASTVASPSSASAPASAATAPFPSFVRWQVEHLAPFLLRPKGVPDDRVRGFNPDVWQKEVMDIIDRKQSALVSVPTSAGKTFICYYAMEQVLKTSDDDVIVYVCPTKALADQVASEVYARFDKPNLPSSRTLVGLFVADKRYDEDRCQVLVCVPQTLEILLQSAQQQGWTQRVKRIIFDEVHNAMVENGEVWERLLMYAPCAVLALSATIGDYDRFCDWLAAVELRRERTLHCIPNNKDANLKPISRWNDLDLFLYSDPKDASTPALTPIHPVASLNSGDLTKGTAAADLHLLPEQAVRLWDELKAEVSKPEWSVPAAGAASTSSGGGDRAAVCEGINALSLDRCFPTTARLRMPDVHAWGRDVLSALKLVAKTDPGAADRIVRSIQRASSIACSNVDDGLQADRQFPYLVKRIPALIQHLESVGKLPAIAFILSKSGCAYLANRLAGALIEAEDAYKATAEHQSRLQAREKKLEAWKKTLEAAIRADETAGKTKGKTVSKTDKADEVPGSSVDGDERVARIRGEIATLEAEAEIDDLGPLPGFALCANAPTVEDIAQFMSVEPAEVRKTIREEIDEYRAEKARAIAAGDELPYLKSLRWSVLLRGVGVHHAAIGPDFKNAVEYFYRKRQLRVCTATGTLSQGINMPCKTVIFAGDSHYIEAMSFRQMSGRAGRRGFDLRGNVVFFGVAPPRMFHFLSSKLPVMTPTCPVTSSQVMRMLVRYDSLNRATLYDDNAKEQRLIADADGGAADAYADDDGDGSVDAGSVAATAPMAGAGASAGALNASAVPDSWDDGDDDDAPAPPPPAKAAAAAAAPAVAIADSWEDEADATPVLPTPAPAAAVVPSAKAALPPAKPGRPSAAAAAALPSTAGTNVRVPDRETGTALQRAEVVSVLGSMQRTLSCSMAQHMIGQGSVLHGLYMRFFLSTLIDNGLLTVHENPLPMTGIVSHLHYAEPANILFCSLLQSGIVGRLIFNTTRRSEDTTYIRGSLTSAYRHNTLDPKVPSASVERDLALLHVLTYLFRRDPPGPRGECSSPETTIVYFRSLPPFLRASLEAFNKRALNSFAGHLRAVVLLDKSGALPDAACLPVSGVNPHATPAPAAVNTAQASGLAGLVTTIARPLLLRSPFAGLDGSASDEITSVADACEGLRPGLAVDAAILPVMDTRVPISRWAVDVYAHGDWKRIQDVFDVDDGLQYDQLDKFMRTLKAIATALTLRWHSLFTHTMAHGSSRPWVAKERDRRWVDPANYDADVHFLVADIASREFDVNCEYGTDTDAERGFIGDIQMLLAELPVVQAFRGLAYRYVRIVTGRTLKRSAGRAKFRKAGSSGARPGAAALSWEADAALEHMQQQDQLRAIDEIVFGNRSPIMQAFNTATAVIDAAGRKDTNEIRAAAAGLRAGVAARDLDAEEDAATAAAGGALDVEDSDSKKGVEPAFWSQPSVPMKC